MVSISDVALRMYSDIGEVACSLGPDLTEERLSSYRRLKALVCILTQSLKKCSDMNKGRLLVNPDPDVLHEIVLRESRNPPLELQAMAAVFNSALSEIRRNRDWVWDGETHTSLFSADADLTVKNVTTRPGLVFFLMVAKVFELFWKNPEKLQTAFRGVTRIMRAEMATAEPCAKVPGAEIVADEITRVCDEFLVSLNSGCFDNETPSISITPGDNIPTMFLIGMMGRKFLHAGSVRVVEVDSDAENGLNGLNGLNGHWCLARILGLRTPGGWSKYNQDQVAEALFKIPGSLTRVSFNIPFMDDLVSCVFTNEFSEYKQTEKVSPEVVRVVTELTEDVKEVLAMFIENPETQKSLKAKMEILSYVVNGSI